MTTLLLLVITVLLAIILTVLVRHIPKGEWFAGVKWWLRLFWAFLLVMSPLSLIVVLVVVLTRTPRPTELPSVVWGIPVALQALSLAPFFLLNESETLWRRLRLSVWWTLMAFAVLLFSWWNPAVRLWSPGLTLKMPLLENLTGAIVVTGAIAVWALRAGWRELGR